MKQQVQSVTPAKAGAYAMQSANSLGFSTWLDMDSRLRGNDKVGIAS